MSPDRMECPNCYAQIEKGDLVWPLPKDYIESLVPGDEIPAGMCPICDDPIFGGELTSSEEEDFDNA
jgi:hypothetical protein